MERGVIKLVECSKKTDSDYEGPPVLYILDPKKVKLVKSPPPIRFVHRKCYKVVFDG